MEEGVHLGLLGIISNWGKRVSTPRGGYVVKDQKTNDSKLSLLNTS